MKKIKEEKWSDSFENRSNGYVEVERQLEIEDLYKALGKLPEIQREALILFEISGFSIKEIAVIQEANEDAVKKRLTRGRQELAKLLTEQPVIV